MAKDLSSKQVQNKKYGLTEEQLREWDQLYCIVHDKNLVLHKRRTKTGRVIRFLDFRIKERK